MTAICAAGIANKAGAVRWANKEGAAGWTSSLTSAVLTGSAFADGTGCGVIASLSKEARRAEEISIMPPIKALFAPVLAPQHCPRLVASLTLAAICGDEICMNLGTTA
ncbi:hypothetical protein [Mesorhizobium jarvisii]|uniref:hypothetical protein n=1 Tax=Mesorhizobium jarvisii TaxID=1777867 RepID=UPI001F0B1E32|nr:hypothetical protein [Mesorhizobium jarvisii]MCH4557688.1 hypothetical protein [Mesorhizobium jarvisii]